MNSRFIHRELTGSQTPGLINDFKEIIMTILFLLLTVSFLVFFFTTCASGFESLISPTGLLKYDKSKAYDGYTLFSPMRECTTTYLINMEGNAVHKWETEFPPGLHSMLLENGNLLIGSSLRKESPVVIGGLGGKVQEYDWDGNLLWEYRMCSDTEVHHHSFWRMPNGNTLLLGFESKSQEEALAKGRKPGTFPDEVIPHGPEGPPTGGKNEEPGEDAPPPPKPITHFWPDFVREVDEKCNVVWEWHAWDHIGEGPDKLDINFKLPDPLGGPYPNFDWTHFNTVSYIPETDQILLNSRNFSEFYLVSYKTGKIEYRWGNPSAYGGGKRPEWYDDGDQKVFGSHHVTRLDNGNFQIFDNGSERPEGNRSRVVEVDPKSGEVVWEFQSKEPNNFYSYRQGAAQRLPNGNVLVTSSVHGHLFEVNQEGEVVWDYINPINLGKPVCKLEDGPTANMIHRAYRYSKDYSGLQGKDLSKEEVLAPGCPEFWKIYGDI
jgi:hypothetical protein